MKQQIRTILDRIKGTQVTQQEQKQKLNNKDKGLTLLLIDTSQETSEPKKLFKIIKKWNQEKSRKMITNGPNLDQKKKVND